MKCDKSVMLLYAVTDRFNNNQNTLYEKVEAALKGGATCVQLREKELPEEEFLAEAIRIRALCAQYHVPFIINDNVDIAVKCAADGVHIGQDDLPIAEVRERVGDEMIIGVTAHTVEEALEAERNGADYLGLSAVFSTSTKTGTRPLTYETLKSICRVINIPAVAIGGISKDNILKLSGSGVDGAAVVSAIFACEDTEKATAELLALSKEMVKDNK